MQSAGDILVVDNEGSIVELIAEVLTDEGYAVRAALDSAHARAMIAEQRPNLALIDLHLPDETGDVLVRDLQEDGLAGVPVVIMSADVEAARDLLMDGIVFCLMKPFDLDDLLDCVATHMRRAGHTVVE